MFPRIREIVGTLGSRVRVSVEPHPTGALILLERPDQRGCPCAILDSYGMEVLCGYIMSARLAVSHALPDENIAGTFPSRLSLTSGPGAAIMLTQVSPEQSFALPAPLWDLLYAELCIVIAHARELGRRVETRMQ